MEIKGLKINFLGDSITEGHGASSKDATYWSVLGKNTGAIVRGYGVGGTRFAIKKEPSANPRHDLDFLMRAKEMDKDADAVVVFGGTNDFGHGDAPLGNPDDNTPYTFWGACNTICEMLLTRFPKSQIVFMGPLHRSVEDDPCGSHKSAPVATLYEYVDIMKTVTRKYSIPFLDLMAVSGIAPRVPVLKEMYIPDGLHPNDAGHEKIAAKLKGFLETL